MFDHLGRFSYIAESNPVIPQSSDAWDSLPSRFLGATCHQCSLFKNHQRLDPTGVTPDSGRL